MRETTVGTPDQIDGVSMRKRFTDKYSEEKKVINGTEYLIFRGKSGSYEANVFAIHNGKSLVFNLMTHSPENFDKELMSMLESIEFE